MRDSEEERLAFGCWIVIAAAFLLAFCVAIELIVRTLNG